MKKREFNKSLLVGSTGIAGMTLLSGCMSQVGKDAVDKEKGEPYRCGRCGYLTRSKTDLTGTRCPRCYSMKIMKITEEEMERYLTEGER